jgi:hypothetical protein
MRAAALLVDGSFCADVLLAADTSLPERMRVAALGRLADRFPTPIHPRRWPRVTEGLNADGQAVWGERILAAVTELTIAFGPAIAPELFGAAVPPLCTPTEAVALFRACLATVLTDDVCAPLPDWAALETVAAAWNQTPIRRRSPTPELSLSSSISRSHFPPKG